MPMLNGLYSGATYYVEPADTTGATAIDHWVDTYMSDPSGPDAIIAITMCPTAFIQPNNSTPPSVDKTVAKPTKHGTHMPRNNKLLTFPYCYLTLDCLNDSKVYRYEWFKSTNCVFHCVGSPAGNPNISIAPMNYHYSGNTLYTNQLIMGGYPQCAIAIDAYKQWLANGGVYNVISQAASFGAMLTAPTATGVGVGAVGLATALAKENIERQRADTARGPVASDANVANRTKDLYFLKMCLPPEKVNSIDDFFDKYGYACEKVKTPNLHARTSWTYVKTKDCIIKGAIPASAQRNMAKLMDEGMTFWAYTATVGDYSAVNDTLS